MSARQHTPRAIRRALDVLLDLPPRVLADLAERLVDKLDALGPDPEAEPDDDGEYDQHGACDAGDDDPASPVPQFGVRGAYGPGDPDDGEHTGDDEPGDVEAYQLFRREVFGVECWIGGGS